MTEMRVRRLKMRCDRKKYPWLEGLGFIMFVSSLILRARKREGTAEIRKHDKH